ncbi:hypothetical protein Gogos_015735, partial [Gossypium gossypioides]|nr:hypothetical protein [Gossypium gossypioides]
MIHLRLVLILQNHWLFLIFLGTAFLHYLSRYLVFIVLCPLIFS